MIGEKFIVDQVSQEEQIIVKQRKTKMNKYIFIGMIILGFFMLFFIKREEPETAPQFQTVSLNQYVEKLASYIEADNVEVLYISGDSNISNRFLILIDDIRYLTVEFYTTNRVVGKRADQLEEVNKLIEEIDSSKAFSIALDLLGTRYFLSDNMVFDNMIIYYSRFEDKEIESQIKNIVSKANSQYVYKLNEGHNSAIRNVDKEVIEKNFDTCLNNLDEQINIRLSQETNFSQKELEAFNASMKPFASIKRVEKTYQKWKRYYDLLVQGKLKSSQEFKDILQFVSKIVYKKGTYTVGVDMAEGYYICVSKKPKEKVYFNQKSWVQDVIVYLKNGEKVELKSDEQLYTLENSPELQVTGLTSGVFKVGQHIKAGTYTLIAGSNQPACYWIIDGHNPDKLLSLSGSTIFIPARGYQEVPAFEKKKITLKEGQIFYLLDGVLE